MELGLETGVGVGGGGGELGVPVLRLFPLKRVVEGVLVELETVYGVRKLQVAATSVLAMLEDERTAQHLGVVHVEQAPGHGVQEPFFLFGGVVFGTAAPSGEGAKTN